MFGLGEHIGDESTDLSLSELSFEDPPVVVVVVAGVRVNDLCLLCLLFSLLLPFVAVTLMLKCCRDCWWRCRPLRLVRLPEGTSTASSVNVSAPRALLGGRIGEVDVAADAVVAAAVLSVRTGMVSAVPSKEVLGEAGVECLSRLRVRNISLKRWRRDLASSAVADVLMVLDGVVVDWLERFASTLIKLCVRLIRRESDIS